MFTQEVIDHLNRDSGEHECWLEDNEVLQPLLSNSHLIIQPTLMPNVRRVLACDNEYGRIISIEQRTYKWSYLVQLNEQYATVELIEDLVRQVDMIDGRYRMENNFLVLELPSGYSLKVFYRKPVSFAVKKIEYVDLEML